MSKHFKNLFIGSILVFIDLKINTFDILPDFIGYIFIILALSNIYNETDVKEFFLARNLSVISMIFSIIGFIYPLNYGIEEYIPSISLLLIFTSILVEVSYMFVMYLGMMKLINDDEVNETFRLRKDIAVVIGLLQLVSFALYPIMDVGISAILIITSLILFIIHIVFLVSINYMKNYYLNIENVGVIESLE